MGTAQKIRKAMQNLESAMQRVEESNVHVTQLAERIAAAETVGVSLSLLNAARLLERKALLSEVTLCLESGLICPNIPIASEAAKDSMHYHRSVVEIFTQTIIADLAWLHEIQPSVLLSISAEYYIPSVCLTYFV